MEKKNEASVMSIITIEMKIKIITIMIMIMIVIIMKHNLFHL